MNISEVHTITFSLTEDERFDAPLASYHTYRGRTAKDGAMVRVNYVKVDVLTETIDAEGPAILVSGGTAGYGHPAQLSDEQIKLVSEWYHLYVGTSHPQRMAVCAHCGTRIGQVNDTKLADAVWEHLETTSCSTPAPVSS
jgi:hypothetical protein